MSRMMSANTIVLEWSTEEMGVGPSIAEGSQGCRPNGANFLALASTRPSRIKFELSIRNIKIC